MSSLFKIQFCVLACDCDSTLNTIQTHKRLCISSENWNLIQVGNSPSLPNLSFFPLHSLSLTFQPPQYLSNNVSVWYCSSFSNWTHIFCELHKCHTNKCQIQIQVLFYGFNSLSLSLSLSLPLSYSI